MSSWFIRIFKKNKKSKKPSQRIQYNSSDEDHHRSIIPKPKLLNTDMLKSQFNSRFVDIKEYKRVLEKISAQMKNTLDENRKLNDRNTALEKENCFLRAAITNNKTLKKEIYWDVNFDSNKLSFTSDAFCLLDCVFHLVFMKSADDIYGFFVCMTYVQAEDESNFQISLNCTFKVHHSFAKPYCKSKTNPLIFTNHTKKGLMIFIYEAELEHYIQDNNIIKLSVVLELAY